jgi:hypothetical protein
LQVNPRVLNSMVSSAKGLEELLSLTEKHGHGFDAIHVSTCLNRYGRCGVRVSRRWQRPSIDLSGP